MAEALYVAVRVASFELVLAFLEQARHRQTLSVSGLQQRFRVPPRCPGLPYPVIPQHPHVADQDVIGCSERAFVKKEVANPLSLTHSDRPNNGHWKRP